MLGGGIGSSGTIGKLGEFSAMMGPSLGSFLLGGTGKPPTESTVTHFHLSADAIV